MRFDINNRKIWQIGSGDITRPYDDICLEFGIATVSPGAPGRAGSTEANAYYKETGHTDWGIVLAQIEKGDLVVLRRGTQTVIAVGEVIQEYDYSILLSDIHGWDSQHYIEVDWYIPRVNIDLSDNRMPYATATQLRNSAILNKIANTDFDHYTGPKRRLSDLKVPNKVSMRDIEQALIKHGLRIQDAENVSRTINRIIRLATWYRDYDSSVLENEIRTFLVIPLLISLGWSEQKIKIEYNHIDIAVFENPYIEKNKKDEPYIIIETKSFKDGLFQAREQAQKYANKYTLCNLMVLTNGYVYKIYEKINGQFEERGYLNLLDMREHHYLDENIFGATNVLLKLSGFKIS